MTAAKEIIKFWGLEVHIYLDSADTNETMTMFKVVVQAGAKMGVPHYHEHFEETLYGLKGITTYMVNGKPAEIGPGDHLFIPRGVVHGFANLGSETAEFLTVINPGVFGAPYFREIAEVINAGGPPDMARLKNIMSSHGLILVLPEPAS